MNLGHLWSLAVEEQFYLVWPFLVRLVKRRTLEKLCLACLLIAPATHFALHFSGNVVGAYVFTPTRLNTLAAGAWLAMVFRDPARWDRWMHFAPRVTLATSGLMLVGMMFPGHLSLVPFSPLFWGALLMLALRPGSSVRTFLSRRGWVWFGKFSYGLYLLHYLFDPWLKEFLFGRWICHLTGGVSPAALAVFVPCAFLLSAAAAWLTWHVLERPMLSLKRYFRY